MKGLACMTGALWAKRGERDISRGERCGARSCRAPREISRSPRLAHKAPVMQAMKGHDEADSPQQAVADCRKKEAQVFSMPSLDLFDRRLCLVQLL